MPYLSILTNARVADVRHSELLAAASRVVASQLSKPESYVMVSIAPGQHKKPLHLSSNETEAELLRIRMSNHSRRIFSPRKNSAT
jgi:hypothetical protein